MPRILLFCGLIFSVGCITEKKGFIATPDRSNTIVTKPIRIDGVYYATYNNSNKPAKELGYFFFYSNGIAIFEHAGNLDSNLITDTKYIEQNIMTDIAFKQQFFKKRSGGGFRINQNQILIQVYRYIPQLNWGLLTFKGNIVNDSTMYISSCATKTRSNYCREDFPLKLITMFTPDSTNRLMGKEWYWRK